MRRLSRGKRAHLLWVLTPEGKAWKGNREAACIYERWAFAHRMREFERSRRLAEVRERTNG